MAKANAAKTLEVGHLVPPRVLPGGHGMLMALFEAIEEFAPEAFEDLRERILLQTTEHLEPTETDTETLERWKARYNLDRWQSEHHARSFDSVAHGVLLGLETTRKLGERSWNNWKGAVGIALSPEVLAFSEWRLLEANDPDLAGKLTIQPPPLKGWNPVLESGKTWRENAHRELAEYQQEVEDRFRREGAEYRSTKRKMREHLEWLVRYQVREEKFEDIAAAIGETGPRGGYQEDRIKSGVQDTAGLIGLTLRLGRGRPRKAST